MRYNVKRETAKRSDIAPVENPPGIFRTTLTYNEQIMLCHFLLKRGAKIPLHHHEAAQNGYLVRGRMRFFREDGWEFIAVPGSAWCFDSNVAHGAEVLEDSEAVECFAPARPEYVP